MKVKRLVQVTTFLALAAMLAWYGTAFAPADEPSSTAPAPKKVTVMNADNVEKLDFPWGELRWLMQSKIDKDATMTFGLVRIDPGKSNPLHMHPNCEEYLYVLSGSCEKTVGDKTVVLNKGDVVRIPQGVPHKAKALGDEPMNAVIVYNSPDRQVVLLEEGRE